MFSLSDDPGNPKIEIPETHSIGWWSNQEALNVDAFEVDIIESNLNMFNTESLISYRIIGHLSYKKGRRPLIKEIHLSERFLTDIGDSTETPKALIEITPIIETIDDDSYDGEKIKFDITNEKIINSFHWGDNQLRFKCLNHTNDIKLSQQK